MTIKKTNDQEIKKYYESTDLNQSSLKKLLHSPKYFQEEKYFKKSEGMILGSAVDSLLTTDTFHDNFHVSYLENLPTDKEKDIADYLIQNNLDIEVNSHLINAMNTINWQSKWKDETRISKIKPKINEYYLELMINKNKEIISSEIFDKAMQISNNFKETEITSFLFDNYLCNKIFNSEVDIEYQVPIYFQKDSYNLKSLIDILISYTDNNGNKKYHIYDIKTTVLNTTHFPSVIKKYNYDIQYAFYIDALSNKLSIDSKNIDFSFVVASTTDNNPPVIFNLNDDFRYWSNILYEKLFSLYKYYEENGYSIDKSIIDNNGIFTLDSNFNSKFISNV